MPVKDTPLTDLLERHIDLKRDYDALLSQLEWVHAVVSILVELEGGQSIIPKNVLENYDLRSQVRIKNDPESDAYVIEVIPFEGDEIS